jgi:putative MATE family efflux protein
MKNTTDLTQGPIFRQLVRLALPIIGTSFMQMAYNLTDMIWLGRVGSEAVASVGAAGFFIWLGMSLLLLTRIGAEVGVSQSMGQKSIENAKRFARHAIFWALVLALCYALVVFIWAPDLMQIFRFSSDTIHQQSVHYLRIVSIGMLFTFVNPTFQGIYNGVGNSRQPFIYLFSGLILNIILDPLLILGIGPFPRLEVGGAAIATVISQLLVFTIFFIQLIVRSEIMPLNLSRFRLSQTFSRKVFSLGSPVALESSLFAIFALVLARMITHWGDTPIAVQSVGAQIEALSWMTSSGFATALASFTGQNYGAGNWERIRRGYFTTISIGLFLGGLVTLVFVLFGESVFGLFLKEPEPLQMGIEYLKILAVSQIFMIIEIITRGAFNGIGKTVPPSVVGITFTGLRIPLALLLSSMAMFGMYGIWWSISLSSVVKGIVLSALFLGVLRKSRLSQGPLPSKSWLHLLPTRIRQQFITHPTNTKNE